MSCHCFNDCDYLYNTLIELIRYDYDRIQCIVTDLSQPHSVVLEYSRMKNLAKVILKG